jgi:uncharacterized protein YbbK (DUF523 family)
MSNPKILISACLLGDSVRYDGKHKLIDHPVLKQWLDAGVLLKQCPEVSGGLSIPRAPAEIQTQTGDQIQVKTIDGDNVTKAFELGASNTLALCLKHKIQIAILTEGSPSCGSSRINDGKFSGNKIAGEGITTQKLRANNIKVFSHHQLEQASEYFQQVIKNELVD